MDKKSKILFAILLIAIFISVAATYYKIMIKRDYIIEARIGCDPEMEKCFVYNCDPESEECSDNLEENTSYYKLIRKNASGIPICDSNKEECAELNCAKNEKNCEIIYCDEEKDEKCDASD